MQELLSDSKLMFCIGGTLLLSVPVAIFLLRSLQWREKFYPKNFLFRLIATSVLLVLALITLIIQYWPLLIS